MPLDEFDDLSAASRARDDPMRKRGWRRGAASVVEALIDDVAYFWWAFAGLGAVILAATVC